MLCCKACKVCDLSASPARGQPWRRRRCSPRMHKKTKVFVRFSSQQSQRARGAADQEPAGEGAVGEVAARRVHGLGTHAAPPRQAQLPARAGETQELLMGGMEEEGEGGRCEGRG